MNSGCRNLEKAPIPNAALVVPKARPPTKFPSRAAAQQTQSLFCKTTSLSFFSAQAVHTPRNNVSLAQWRWVKGRRIGLLRMMNGSDANGKSAAYLA